MIPEGKKEIMAILMSAMFVQVEISKVIDLCSDI